MCAQTNMETNHTLVEIMFSNKKKGFYTDLIHLLFDIFAPAHFRIDVTYKDLYLVINMIICSKV